MDTIRIREACCTAAFFMEGVHDVGYDTMLRVAADDCGLGAVEIVADLSHYAALSEQLVMALEAARMPNYIGVYDYEVSVTFGAWYASWVIDYRNLPGEDTAANMLLQYVKDFFGQEEPLSSAITHELHRVTNEWLAA